MSHRILIFLAISVNIAPAIYYIFIGDDKFYGYLSATILGTMALFLDMILARKTAIMEHQKNLISKQEKLIDELLTANQKSFNETKK